MQINRSNSSKNSFQNPSFGKVLKFENGFQKYMENVTIWNKYRYSKQLEAYADFLDVFHKSKPIKDYIAKHDVNIKFELESDGLPAVSIIDSSLDPNLSRTYVLLVRGKDETQNIDKLSSSFKSLTKQIKELPTDFLEKRLKEFQADAEKKLQKLLELGKNDDYIKKIINDNNNRIQKSLDEIKNW